MLDAFLSRSITSGREDCWARCKGEHASPIFKGINRYGDQALELLNKLENRRAAVKDGVDKVRKYLGK